MATLELISECLLALNDRTGSSLPAINKWIDAEKKVSDRMFLVFFLDNVW